MDSHAWDDIFLNPYQKHYCDGRIEGLEKGLQNGYDSGFILGCTKGIEYSMELGFIRKTCEILNAKENPEHLSFKILEVLRMIKEFPNLDVIFPNNGENNIDLRHCLQRIRAKYKVLMIHFKNPTHSIQSSLTAESIQKTTHW
jgi:hypothetical protein